MDVTKIKRFYQGFDLSRYEDHGVGFDIYNVECVEQDLMNAIFTVKGTGRVHMPEYGTRIPIMTFEPADKQSIELIKDDLETVFKQEPRVRLESLEVIDASTNNALIAVAKVTYLEFAVTKDLMITLNT